MLTHRIRRFWKDESAAIAMETVIITPVLAWCFIASFVFFDAFRTYNSSIKATYAVADLVSRQRNTLTEEDIDGYAGIFEHLVRNNGDARIRVSQLFYNGNTDTFCVEWSDATNGEAELFTGNIPDIEELLPRVAHAERLILVQSFIPYQPVFDTGLDVITFRNFTFTRPRNNRVPFEDMVNC